jgi:nucleoside-diphosphate-sugar epimerase
MHTILGAGGAVSPDLARILTSRHIPFQQVSRSAKAFEHGIAKSADLMDPKGALSAVEGCEVAYLTVGLPYSFKVWSEQWKPLMHNVVNACIQTGTKLIFLDNIYMVSDNSIPHITEDASMNASSKKGKIRAEVDQILLNAVAEGKLQGIVARAADFYGFMSPNKSLPLDLILRRMANGKAPQWFYSVNYKHSFTYVPDIANAMYLMATTPQSFNQIWNLPSAPPITVKAFIDITNAQLGTHFKPAVLNEFIMTFIRLMVPPINEMKELKYQMVQDYWLDSSKFENFFNVKPTSYEQGIKETLALIKK